MNRRDFLALSASVFGLTTQGDRIRFDSAQGYLLDADLPRPLVGSAVDPATAVLVAKAGLELYKMSRGGGGTASILQAQTEMLRSISAQLVIVNDGIQKILEGIEGLKDLIRQLPSETVRAIASNELRASFTNVSEKLERFALLRDRYGYVHAQATVAPDAALTISILENRRAVLLGDESPLAIPLACTCWYVEFQALCTLVPFERERILSVARTYERWLARTIPLVKQLITRIEEEAEAVLKTQPMRYPGSVDMWALGRGPRPRYDCYTDYKRDVQLVGGLIGYLVRLSAVHHKVRWVSEIEEDSTFAQPYDQLETLGVRVHPALRALRMSVRTYHSRNAVGVDWRRFDNPEVVALEPKITSAICPDLAEEKRRLVTTFENRRKTVQNQALAHYHFAVACREAEQSVKSVIRRLAV